MLCGYYAASNMLLVSVKVNILFYIISPQRGIFNTVYDLSVFQWPYSGSIIIVAKPAYISNFFKDHDICSSWNC